ncbi:MAG: dihydroorotase [Bacteroidetes bacterium]|nr:dihydroorotase [Bacteroidota bacterium]
MDKRYQIINVQIVNDGRIFPGSVLIDGGIISSVIEGESCQIDTFPGYEIIRGGGNYLIPGIIDDQVHFRDPGLTHKADIHSESRAAVAGGITSYMEMPNTVPNTLTQELLEEKYQYAANKSLANFSFYMGASNDNIEEIIKTNPQNVCGVKVFMGASTGNMLVDDPIVLEKIFKLSPTLVAVHCEDEEVIQKNIKRFKDKFGEDVPIKYHPEIRSEEACFNSSYFAVELAKKHNTRLHILHLSTGKELALFDNSTTLKDKRITSELCVHHLAFNENDYKTLGTLIKWNPAIKTKADQEALLAGLLSDKLDVIATDHAPHTLDEKKNTYFKAPSGGPLVQHSLPIMLEFMLDKKINLEKVIDKMCHAPAICFQLEKRGFIREGYFADLVIVNVNDPWKVSKDNLQYKCKWSPFDGREFRAKVSHTFVNGHLAFRNGIFDESIKGKRLTFLR